MYNGVTRLVRISITMVFFTILLFFAVGVPLLAGGIAINTPAEEKLTVEIEDVNTNSDDVDISSVHEYDALTDEERDVLDQANDGETVNVSTTDTPELFAIQDNDDLSSDETIGVVTENAVYVYEIDYQSNQQHEAWFNAIILSVFSVIVSVLLFVLGHVVHEAVPVFDDGMLNKTVGRLF